MTLPSPLLQHFRALGGGLPMDVGSQLRRLGAIPVAPSGSSGFEKYAAMGRLFLLGSDPDNTAAASSVLTHPISAAGFTLLRQAQGTVAGVIVPYSAWGSSGVNRPFFSLAPAGVNAKPYLNGYGGSCAFTVSDAKHINAPSSISSWGAGSTHTFVARWLDGTQLDFNVDGVDSAPVALAAGDVTAPSTIRVGNATASGAPTDLNGYAGCFVVSPNRKSDLWTPSWRNVATDPVRVYLEYMDAGEALLPLLGDGTMYVKPSGSGLPFEVIGRLAFEGNSMTDGNYTQYPAKAAALLPSSLLYVNLGHTADSTPDLIAQAATTNSYRIPYANKNVLVVWEGRNDACVLGASKEDVYAHLVTYCQAAMAAGWLVVLVTLPPSHDATLTYEAKRVWVNAQLAANQQSICNQLVVLAQDPHFDDETDHTDQTVFRDGVHLTSYGEDLVAAMVAQGVSQAIAA